MKQQPQMTKTLMIAQRLAPGLMTHRRLSVLIASVFLLSGWKATAATFYVSTTGSDSNPGTQAQPVLTIKHGLELVSPGDTLLVQPGSYTTATYIPTVKAGTSSNRITIKANGAVIVKNIGFFVGHPYYTVDGFTFDSVIYNDKVNANVVVGTNANYTVVQNCLMQNCTATHGIWMLYADNQTPAVKSLPEYSAHDCVFTNNTFSNIFGGQCHFVSGSNNLVVKSFITKLHSGDCFIFHGCSNIFRGNIVTNCDNPPGGLHPDIMQTYGTDGNVGAPTVPTYGNTFEQNQFWDWQGALAQMTVDNPNTNDLTFRVEGPLIRNNLYVRCGPTNGSVSSIDTPNTRYLNNTFIRCGTWPDSSGHVLNFSYYDNGILTPTARGQATNCMVMNNAFIGCGQNFGLGWYGREYHSFPVKPTDLIADYNLVLNWNGTTWGTKTGFSEPHGVNTGADPKLVEFTGSNFRPMLSSPLIDAGTNLSSFVFRDIEGTTRPSGGAFDIGAYEFDPNLLVHFDFDESITGRILDVTGNGHDGVQFNPTNWITTTAGVMGSAGKWSVVGIITNDPPQVYNLSQHAGITNITGINFITNGTIAVWVQWATNGERWDSILDCGYPIPYSWDPTVATNSWALHYGSPDLNLNPSGPVFKRYGSSLNDTNGVLLSWTQPRDGSNWWHIAVAWNGSANSIVGYQNGVPIQTNTLGAPYLRISGSPRLGVAPFTVIPHLTVGAMQHDGTPQWGDDRYPNSGFFKGKMDDLRIYNRTLSIAEVASLYAGTAAALQPQSPPATNPTPTVTLVASPASISSGQSSTLTWTSTDATNVTLTGFGQVALSGSVGVSPATTASYTATATGAGGTALASATVNVTPSFGTNLLFEAEAGVITAPFIITNGYIYQSVQTTNVSSGGRASYTFNIAQAGEYAVVVVLNAPGDASNSLFLNMDAEPQDPGMIWDIPVTSGFQSEVAAWRGNGTTDQNQFVPVYFNLAVGQHQLIIRGREANVQLDRISIVKRPAPPGLLVL